MSSAAKPRALLLRDSSRDGLAIKALDTILRKISEYSFIDSATIHSAEDLLKMLSDLKPESTIFIDETWISESKIPFQKELKQWNIVIVNDGTVNLGALDTLALWRKEFSYLNLKSLVGADLARTIQVVLLQDRYPGIFVLSERASEIYYAKVESLAQIGQKIDGFTNKVEKRFPALIPQLFNLRQLSFSILHQAFLASSAVNKIIPVVDFQITANPTRIAFAVRFNAAPGTLAQWMHGISKGENLIWHNARLSSDLLIFTELSKTNQIEVKALIDREGQFSSNKEKTVIARTISDFHPDGVVLEAQKANKFQTLKAVAGPALNADSEAPSGAQEELVEAQGTQLNFKIKASMLETEKNNLQNLVKKKNHLVTSLTKDVNRAQRELAQVQNSANKEIHKMRLEMERDKTEARKAVDKMKRMERQFAEKKAEEEAAAANGQAGVVKQDFEKDFKQADYARRMAEERLKEVHSKNAIQEEQLQTLRKDLRAATQESSEVKAKLFKVEQTLESKARAETVKETAQVAKTVTPGQDDTATKLKEAQKIAMEAKAKEQDFEKEIKRLNIKLEGAEKNQKVSLLALQKKLESSEKVVEEAKRQKSEAMKKLEDLQNELKKKIEEKNATERDLKNKINELSADPTKKKAA